MNILCLALGRGAAAVEHRWVSEITILSRRCFRKMSGSVAPLIGVCSHSGKVISVLDLGVFLGTAPLLQTDGIPALVCHLAQGTVAMAVSAVLAPRVVDEPLQSLSPQLKSRERFLLGMTEDGVGVIDLERLLSDEGLSLLNFNQGSQSK
jgi:chemotaxis signal transduction protein